MAVFKNVQRQGKWVRRLGFPRDLGNSFKIVAMNAGSALLVHSTVTVNSKAKTLLCQQRSV